jgi:hypothetical protein
MEVERFKTPTAGAHHGAIVTITGEFEGPHLQNQSTATVLPDSANSLRQASRWISNSPTRRNSPQLQVRHEIDLASPVQVGTPGGDQLVIINITIEMAASSQKSGLKSVSVFELETGRHSVSSGSPYQRSSLPMWCMLL